MLASRSERLEQAEAKGRVEDTGGWRLRKDGTRFWANVVITAMRDRAGKLYGFSKITRDITERRGAEQRLQRAAEKLETSNRDLEAQKSVLRTILDNIPAFVTVRDVQNEYRYTLINRRLGGIGFDEEDLGKNVYDLVPKTQADELMQADRRVAESGTVDRVDRQIVDSPTGRSILTDDADSDRRRRRRDSLCSRRVRGYYGARPVRTIPADAARHHAGPRPGPHLRCGRPVVAQGPCPRVGAPPACLLWIDKASQTLRLRSHWTSTEGTAAFAEESRAFSFARGIGLPGRAWETASPHGVLDVTLDPNFPRLVEAKTRDIRGAFAFPILGNAGVLGVAEIFCHRAEGADDALRSVLAGIGAQIGQFHDRRVAEESYVGAIERSQREFRDVIEKLPACIMIRRGETLIYANPATAVTTGYQDARELVGRSFFELVHPASHELFWQRMSGTASSDDREMLALRADGTTMRIEVAPQHIPITFEGAPAFLTSIRDVTEERRTKALLEEQAQRMQALSLIDELTRLHNRRGFLTLGEQQLRMAARQKRPAVVIFVDLDGLKGINDKLGHQVGDEAIIEAANILRSTFRDVDIVARIGGDEFVAMMADSNAPDAILRRLAAAVASYNEKATGPFRISISVGAATFDPAEPQALEDLVRQADAAMYEQKQKRRGIPRG